MSKRLLYFLLIVAVLSAAALGQEGVEEDEVRFKKYLIDKNYLKF